MTTGLAPAEVAANVTRLRERIARACDRARRDPASVTLVAVSKTFGPEAILAAVEAGVTDIGENRVQEAIPKFAAARAALGSDSARLTTHLVGHLQTNKVRPALAAFAILQAVDSQRLLQAINSTAAAPVQLLIEVNVSGETTKYGIAPGALPALLDAARTLPRVSVRGLMTVASRVAEPAEARPYFAQLAALARHHGLPWLSMGMSEDFEVAIEEGATHVRLGRAIFGDRP